MAGFFDKLKQGALEAGKKTQVTVEVNRLKLSISGKEKEISKIQTSIGVIVYEAVQKDNLEEVYPQILALCGEINAKKEEIVQVSEKIRVLRDEKVCPSCSKVATRDTKFCSGCGHHFNEESLIPIEDEDLVTVAPTCPSCEKEIESDAKFCGHCGHTIEQ